MLDNVKRYHESAAASGAFWLGLRDALAAVRDARARAHATDVTWIPACEC
jgi:hypothetical protein